MSWDDLCRDFLHKYSYNADLLITLKDLELIKEEGKEGFSDYHAGEAKATHMADWSSEADQVR